MNQFVNYIPLDPQGVVARSVYESSTPETLVSRCVPASRSEYRNFRIGLNLGLLPRLAPEATTNPLKLTILNTAIDVGIFAIDQALENNPLQPRVLDTLKLYTSPGDVMPSSKGEVRSATKLGFAKHEELHELCDGVVDIYALTYETAMPAQTPDIVRTTLAYLAHKFDLLYAHTADVTRQLPIDIVAPDTLEGL